MRATLGLFILSILFHWIFGWKVFVNTQKEHNPPVEFKEYVQEMMKDTMENWQSEFLQLKEEKLDFIIKQLDPGNYSKLMKEWEAKYPKK